jgi:hypothetical protein
MFFDSGSFDPITFLIASLPYLFGFAVFLFIVVGGILDYHWRTYGVGLIRLAQFRLIFVGVGLVVLSIMYGAYILF